jgi:hypothetical protein
MLAIVVIDNRHCALCRVAHLSRIFRSRQALQLTDPLLRMADLFDHRLIRLRDLALTSIRRQWDSRLNRDAGLAEHY